MGSKIKYYFVSDVHLRNSLEDGRDAQMRFLRFLDMIECDARALYLLGDIFDFWYEYRDVIPRGHTRVLGRLARLIDSGVEVYFFKGNHDVWAYDYFEKELGITILNQPFVTEIEGKCFCLGHGDGLGKADTGFRIIRWMFHNRFLQILFSAIHPRWAICIGNGWSASSRRKKTSQRENAYKFKIENEPIFRFADLLGRQYRSLNERGIDYYIFGHFHLPSIIHIPSGGDMYILGDWINSVSRYAVFDGETLSMEKFSR